MNIEMNYCQSDFVMHTILNNLWKAFCYRIIDFSADYKHFMFWLNWFALWFKSALSLRQLHKFRKFGHIRLQYTMLIIFFFHIFRWHIFKTKILQNVDFINLFVTHFYTHAYQKSLIPTFQTNVGSRT